VRLLLVATATFAALWRTIAREPRQVRVGERRTHSDRRRDELAGLTQRPAYDGGQGRD